MPRTDNASTDQPDASADTVAPPAAAPGGLHVDGGVPLGETHDISEAAGAPAGGPVIEIPAPMFWMRSIDTGNVFPAFNLGQREELSNNGCEELALDDTPDGMPKATGMAGTGLLA